MENIRVLESKKSGALKPNETAIAVVLEQQDGIATSVCVNDEWFAVEDCLSGVARLNSGDRVVVQNIQDSLVVMQKLRSKDESKAPTLTFEDSQWHLQCDEGFTLKVGKATLAIEPNGQIVIEGQDILTDATGINRLLGSRIELN